MIRAVHASEAFFVCVFYCMTESPGEVVNFRDGQGYTDMKPSHLAEG